MLVLLPPMVSTLLAMVEPPIQAASKQLGDPLEVALRNSYGQQLAKQLTDQHQHLHQSQHSYPIDLPDPLVLRPVDLILIGILISVIVISVVGNCLVCVAIFTDRRLRKLGNAFIVSLAIADLFVSCLVMTFALCNDFMNYWIFGEWFCDIWISFDIMCSTASILNLCAISLDRFIHIKDCLLYNRLMTKRVAIGGVMLIWFISALVSFVPINLGWHKPPMGEPLTVGQQALSHRHEHQHEQHQQHEHHHHHHHNHHHQQQQHNQHQEEHDHQHNHNHYNHLQPQQQQQLQQQQHNNHHQPAINKSNYANNDRPQCMLTLTPTYAIISSSISFYIPCIIMLGLYTKLFACAQRHVRHIQAMNRLAGLTPSSVSASFEPSTFCSRSRRPRTYWLKLAGRRLQRQLPAMPGNLGDKLEACQAATSPPANGPNSSPPDQLEPFLPTSTVHSTSKRTTTNDTAERAASLSSQQQQQQNYHHHNHLTTNQQQQSGQLATHKAAITLGIIMGTFLFCWVPFFCLNIIRALCVDCIPSPMFKAITWLGYANSALNPIIYGIHNSEFRCAFNRIFFKHLTIRGRSMSSPMVSRGSGRQQRGRGQRQVAAARGPVVTGNVANCAANSSNQTNSLNSTISSRPHSSQPSKQLQHASATNPTINNNNNNSQQLAATSHDNQRPP